MIDEHGIEYATGAVLAQIEDLGLRDRIQVLRSVMDNLVPAVIDPTTVSIPGRLSARYRDGDIEGWTFEPAASYAGYMGPAAAVEDGDADLDVESTDGPFWSAVQAHLQERETIAVHWEE